MSNDEERATAGTREFWRRCGCGWFCLMEEASSWLEKEILINFAFFLKR